MTYVVSDIHGHYEAYQALLKKISFSQGDLLFVLGDVVDRGPRPISILLDMAQRENVIPLLGNHEWMFLQSVGRLPWNCTLDDFMLSLDTQA